MELKIVNLSQNYGNIYALKNVTMTLNEGVYGLLGPNGAGKSTLMNLITDNLKRTNGDILLNGKEILSLGSQYRSLIGYMPQQQGFYEQFTPTEFLKYIGSLKALNSKLLKQQIDEILNRVNLSEYKHVPLAKLSGGMRQRVLLAQALLGEPKILILDEPSAGLDPKERINTRELIGEIAQDKIVILATHIVSDIDNVAKEIILLKSGVVLKKETPKDLIDFVSEKINKKDVTLEDVYMYFYQQD